MTVIQKASVVRRVRGVRSPYAEAFCILLKKTSNYKVNCSF